MGVLKNYETAEAVEKALDNGGAAYNEIPSLQNAIANTYNKDEVDAMLSEIPDLVTEKVAEIIAGAPEDFDTLKELYDWLVHHEDSAAAMNTAIQKNASDISQNTKDISTNAENAAINNGTIGYKKRNYLYNGSASRERYGITATVNEDGSITLNGTSTSNSAFMLFSNLQTGATPEGSQFSNNKLWIPSGKYVMSQGGISGVNLQIRLAEVANSEGDYASCSTGEATVIVAEKYKYVWCRILISANASFNNVTIYPMIRAFEDTDSSFTPYEDDILTKLTSIEERLLALEGATNVQNII